MMQKVFLILLLVISSASWANLPYDSFVKIASRTHGVDAKLIHAVIWAESSYRSWVCSNKSACGLMQIIPGTAKRFGLDPARRKNPYLNIMAGTKYLAWLINHFNGNLEYVLAGYNAGEHRVKKYGGIPPFNETQNYVRKVLARYKGKPYKAQRKLYVPSFFVTSVTKKRKTPNFKKIKYSSVKTKKTVIEKIKDSILPTAGSKTVGAYRVSSNG